MANILYRKQKEQVSYDAGQTWIDTGNFREGEVLENPSNCVVPQYRWIELSSDEGYYCNFNTQAKYTLQVEEVSLDGVIWNRTGNQRQGSTLIEENSSDCGSWDVFDTQNIQCYLNRMKSSTFTEPIDLGLFSNYNMPGNLNFCDFENDVFVWVTTSSNPSWVLNILDVTNGTITEYSSGKWYIYTLGFHNNINNSTDEYVESNIYKTLFINTVDSTRTFFKYTDNGFVKLLDIDSSNFEHECFAYTNEYTYIYFIDFGIIKVNNNTLECSTTEVQKLNDSDTSAPTELIKTIDGVDYYLQTEYGNVKYYLSNYPYGGERVQKLYINDVLVSSTIYPTNRISDYIICTSKINDNTWGVTHYIKNDTIYTIPDNFHDDIHLCLGDNTYYHWSYDYYLDLNDNTMSMHTNRFTKYMYVDYIFSEKYKVFIDTYNESIKFPNGKVQYLDYTNPYAHGNGIWENGIIEYVGHDEHCYLENYNIVLKRVEDYIHSKVGDLVETTNKSLSFTYTGSSDYIYSINNIKLSATSENSISNGDGTYTYTTNLEKDGFYYLVYCDKFFSSDSTDRKRLISLNSFPATDNVLSCEKMFYGNTRITNLNLNNWNTNRLNNVYDMFNGCSKLKTLNASSWNVSNITTFDGMFTNCTSLRTLTVKSGTESWWEARLTEAGILSNVTITSV